MIFDLLRGGATEAIISLMIVFPIILMALTFHEYAHGWMANKLGDPTARNMGRLTLNPMKHLDLFGTLAMLIAGIGWARPVPINSRYFKKPKRDMALTGLAGPMMNFLLAFIGISICALYVRFVPIERLSRTVVTFFYYFGYLNSYLAVFNLLPVPPFDGSRIFYAFLPDKYYWGVMKHERTIMLVAIIAILALSRIGYNPFGIFADMFISGVLNLYGLIL